MTDVKTEVHKTVQAKLDAGEPFTSACISHPIILDDGSVRHYDCNREIRHMWRTGQLIDAQGELYVRTSVTVWPDGPGGPPANAWLYHPDDYDPASFKPVSRVLVRGKTAQQDDDDKSVTVTATSDGFPVSRQCEVQAKDGALNIPRCILKETGWLAGDGLVVDVSGSIVTVRRAKAGEDASQCVDREQRVRLYGKTVAALQTRSPVAYLVEPKGGWKYVQVSATLPDDKNADTDTDVATPVASAPTQGKSKAGRGVSVWD